MSASLPPDADDADAPDPTVESWLSRAAREDAPPIPPGWMRLQDELDAEHGLAAWLRSRPSEHRLALVALVAALVPLLVWMLTPRVDLEVMPPPRLWLDVGLMSLSAAVALAVLMRPLHRPAPARWIGTVTFALGVGAIAVVCLMPQAHTDHPASLGGVGDDLAARALGCFSFGSALAIPVLLVLRGFSRSTGRWWSMGAVTVAVIVLIGSLGVYLHCPLTAPEHLLAGHATIWLPFLGLAWWGRRSSAELGSRV